MHPRYAFQLGQTNSDLQCWQHLRFLIRFCNSEIKHTMVVSTQCKTVAGLRFRPANSVHSAVQYIPRTPHKEEQDSSLRIECSLRIEQQVTGPVTMKLHKAARCDRWVCGHRQWPNWAQRVPSRLSCPKLAATISLPPSCFRNRLVSVETASPVVPR